MTDTPIAINVLGPIEAEAEGRRLGLRGPKRLGLLALLALREQAIPVESIAAAIWPGQPQEQATRSIRTYLSQFRRDAGLDFIGTDNTATGYRLEAGMVEVDAGRFRRAVETASRPDVSPAQVQTITRDALDLWRGPPLLEVRDQTWAQHEIQVLDELHRTAQHLLVKARLALGDHVALCGELEMLVTEHPFDESFWADLMLAQYRSGRQTDALRSFQRARSILVDELSLEPGPDLVALEGAIFRHDEDLLLTSNRVAAGSPGRTGPATSAAALKSDLAWVPAPTFPVVGRDADIDHLTELVANRPATSQLVLIEGLPGQGKSRLLGELAQRIPDDALVVYGRPTDSASAYGLWQRAVRLLLPHAPADLEPFALDRLSSIAGVAADDQTTGSARPHTAVVDLLVGAIDERFIVVVLDDLHDADEPSLALLEHVIQQSRHPVLVVAATRPIAPGTDGAALSRLINAAAESGRLHLLELDPLPEDAVAELVANAGLHLDDPAALWDNTGGNALLVTETLLDGRRGSASGPVGRNVQDRVRDRLAGYGEETRALAQAAALVGNPFDAMLAGEATDLRPEQVAAAVDELLADYLIEAVPNDPGLFEFSHPLLAEATRSLIPAGSLPVRHRAIAEALEHRQDRGAPVDIAVLAHHWAEAGRAGDLHRAVECLRQAAGDARRRFGYETAARHLRRAIALQQQQGGSPETAASLHLELAGTENAAGDVNAAKAACVAAADAARVTDRADLLADAAIEYGGDIPMAEDVVDEHVLTLLSEADARSLDSARRARVRSRMAQVEYWLAGTDTRRSWCDEAMQLAHEIGDPAPDRQGCHRCVLGAEQPQRGQPSPPPAQRHRCGGAGARQPRGPPGCRQVPTAPVARTGRLGVRWGAGHPSRSPGGPARLLRTPAPRSPLPSQRGHRAGALRRCIGARSGNV